MKCNLFPFFFFFWAGGGGGLISGRVRALNLTAPLGSGRVGSDDLGYGPGSGFSFEPVQTSRPATRTATATIGLHNQIIHAQTVRNRLREVYLHVRRPHRGLDLTAVCHRNRFKWANAHIRWRLALWRGVLFMDESRFSLYRADGRQCLWRHVGERFADVKVVDRVAHGGSGVMVWAGVCYGQRTQVHFIDGILNAQRYREEILRPIFVPFCAFNLPIARCKI